VHHEPVEVERLAYSGMVADPSGHDLSCDSGNLCGGSVRRASRKGLDGGLLARVHGEQSGTEVPVIHEREFATDVVMIGDDLRPSGTSGCGTIESSVPALVPPGVRPASHRPEARFLTCMLSARSEGLEPPTF
jgi:hypothetical protein